MNDSDSFFDRGRQSSRSDESRPRAVNPRTGVEQSWQRASNYAAPLDNPHGLIKWQLRELIKGISLRPDLARMLLTGAAIEDNTKADEIIADAHAAVALDAKANNGTAVHAALSRSFLGHEVPAEYMPHVQAFAAELQRNGLTPVATEVRTLCVALGVIGHTDWVVKTADGRYLILDVKTGKLGDAKRKFAVQCKAYAGAEYIDDGNGGWVPIPFALDQTEAILAHVDPETGATALYRIDLVLGFYGATLAERVRDWAKIEVLSPYVPVHHAVPRTVDVPFVPPVSAPTTAVAAPAIPSSAAEPARVENRGTVDAAAVGLDLRKPTEQHAAAPVAPSTDPAQIEAERADLMQARNDKGTLQVMAKNLGCTDLAHNRMWLADWIIATRRGLDNSAATMYAKSKGTMALPGQVSAPAQASPAQASPEQGSDDLSFLFRSIEGAKSVAAIAALRDNVVQRRGDQAWTPEMTEAARARTAELDAQSGTAASPALQALGRIGQATEPQHIAALWNEVTAGGALPDNWTTELREAADARLIAIQAAQAPPPANPYGPQQ